MTQHTPLLAGVMFSLLCVSSMATSASVAAMQSFQTQGGVQKVIKMLEDMSATAKKEMADEQVAFGKFTVWCKQETASLAKEIEENGESIEMLGTEIGKLTQEVEELGEAIKGLQDGVAKDEADVKSETAQREKDHAAFLEEEKDYSESVDALERAIATLAKQDYDRPALLQLSQDDRLPLKAKTLVTSLLGLSAEKADAMDYEAPEANAYEFQSGGIVDLLKKLLAEFTAKLGQCQKEEMNSKHAYDMVIADLTDSIENAEKEIEAKTVEKEQKSEKSASNKKQLSATVADQAENEKLLKSTETECSEKKLSFAEKQKLRKEELEAIAKAIEILSSDDVSGNADKYLSLAQSQKSTSFVQGGSRNQGIRRQIHDFLAAEGARKHSKGLTLLAQQISADPFAKVKKLIDDMITRLLEEAEEDAKHEGFCDKEMGKSKITRNKLTEDIDGLEAAIEEGKATIQKLADDTATLTKEVEELVKSMAEATDLRTEEKATNKVTVKDAQAAQKAVAAATAVLKDFYEKAATATALMQAKTPNPRQWGLKTGVKMGTDEWNALANPNFKGTVDKGHKEDMQTFGESYDGQQDEAKYGILALLEVVQSDFANLEADTTAAEEAAQKAYEDFVAESKKNQAVKEKKIEMNTSDKAAAETKLQEDIADLKSTQDELLAAERYYKKLVPQCVDQGMTWEERVKARESEIASLKEALSILSQENIATSA
jgi:septal ring factor EnvC (AmiA/AmiB activator)